MTFQGLPPLSKLFLQTHLMRLTGSAGPQNSLNVCGASVPWISKTMQGPEHSSFTISFRGRREINLLENRSVGEMMKTTHLQLLNDRQEMTINTYDFAKFTDSVYTVFILRLQSNIVGIILTEYSFTTPL